MHDKSLAHIREKIIENTKKQLNQKISNDKLVILLISNIDELESATRMLTKRLHDFYSIYIPELDTADNKKFLELTKKSKEELLNHLQIKKSIGADIPKEMTAYFDELNQNISKLYMLQKNMILYLEKNIVKHAPDLSQAATPLISARLIKIAGSLEELAKMPSSKIQVLGAEKAFFKHLKDKKRKLPKYGVIFTHHSIQSAENKGKAARELAAKISLSARKDFFR